MPREYHARVSVETRAILLATDQATGRATFQRWGELKGVCAELMIVLAGPFRSAMRDERLPAAYPFTSTTQLTRRLKCPTDEALRRRVLRCRNAIANLAQSAGDPLPPIDAVIENHPWRGYRLNPDLIRLVALAELEEAGHASRPEGHDSRPGSPRSKR